MLKDPSLICVMCDVDVYFYEKKIKKKKQKRTLTFNNQQKKGWKNAEFP